MPDQTGRIALVTGANSGLGLRTAKALAARGAAVILACRDPRRGAHARDDVAKCATAAAPMLIRLDLADLVSVREAASQVIESVPRLDLLINNAGIMFAPRGETVDGFELHIGTNHHGHFVLTASLVPVLLAAPAARVVTVSSLASFWGRISLHDLDKRNGRWWDGWPAYSASKLADLLFARELHRRCVESGASLLSVAAHPGGSKTNLAHSVGNTPHGLAVRTASKFMQEDAMGALPQLHAATAPGIAGGDFVGPTGPFGVRGFPGLSRYPRTALDLIAAQTLWEATETRTGTRFAI